MKCAKKIVLFYTIAHFCVLCVFAYLCVLYSERDIEEKVRNLRDEVCKKKTISVLRVFGSFEYLRIIRPN